MADVSRICEELGEDLTDEELAELARELGDHLGFGSTHHEHESGARDAFARGRDRRARDNESELRYENGYSPVFGRESPRRDMASFSGAEGRHHSERARLLDLAEERERQGDYGGAADARRRAAAHDDRARDRRRARANDEPFPFAGRPRPGGAVDPAEAIVRDRIRAILDSDAAHDLTRRHPEAARDFAKLRSALASDAARFQTSSSDFNLRYAGTALAGNKITTDFGPTGVMGVTR